MTEEFYHKNIFGDVVDVDLNFVEDEERLATFDKKDREFNIFTFTDAVGSRQKKQAWVLYQRALSVGISAEEIFFRLVWQIKTMLLASKTKNAGEADMKTFPYSKAKGFLKNFQIDELEALSGGLVVGYNSVRRGKEEMEMFVEKILLSL